MGDQRQGADFRPPPAPQVALDAAQQALGASQAEAAAMREQLQGQARDAAALGAEAVRAGERLRECRRELEAVSL